MSLQVWLPLTKDLRQQGLSNVTVTNNGATFNSAGKLGGCYSFDGSDDFINLGNISSNFTGSTHHFSICFWIYSSESGTRGVIFSSYGLTSTSNFFSLEINSGSVTNNSLRFDWKASPDWASDIILTPNNWIHVGVTYDGTSVRFYKNGELIQTKSQVLSSLSTSNDWYLGRDYRTGTTAFSGKLNDFRIYDHCLSPMEIKEIAKGLVLHYPLNRQGFGQENLILNSANISVNKLNNALDSRTEYWAANLGQSYSNFIGGEKVVLSFDCEVIVRTLPVYFLVYNTNNKGPIQFPTTTISSQINNLNPSIGDIVKLRVKVPVTMIKRSDSTVTNNFIEFYTNYGSNNFYKITNLKLEEGSIATPWCPNSSDALATTMGLNGTTEYDCSGFCNNLNKNGTYSYTSDTPKYVVSTIFNGTEWMNGTTPGADILTLSCWAKTAKSKSTSQFMVADSTSKLCISFYSGTIISYFSSSGTGTGSKCTLGSAYKENDWNHFVVVKTGDGTRTVYCNGVEQTPTSNDYWSVATGFFIGSRNTSGTLPFYGQLCDVRAYATALSAEDILNLYKQGHHE